MGGSCSSSRSQEVSQGPSESEAKTQEPVPKESVGAKTKEGGGQATPTVASNPKKASSPHLKSGPPHVGMINEEGITGNADASARSPPSVKNSAKIAKYASEGHDNATQFQLVLQSFRPDEHHVVVVDDDVPTLKSLVRWLQECGYLVSTCGSGQELMDLLNLASTDADGGGERAVNDINVILVDITMQTINGPVLDQVRAGKYYGHIPVILMGFDVTPQEAARLMRRGSADFLHKPMSATLLLRSVRLLLETRVEQQNAKVLKKEGDKYKRLAKEGPPSAVKSVSLSRASSSRSVLFPQQGCSSTILIVDGTPTAAEAEIWLAGAGYEVTICDTADDAVKMLDEIERMFSLVLCSLEFPVGGDLTGPQLMKFISDSPKLNETPVILIAEEDGADIRETSQLLRLGAENCIRRPISKELLLTKVNQVLRLLNQQHKSTAYLERAAKYKGIYGLMDSKGDPTHTLGFGVQEAIPSVGIGGIKEGGDDNSPSCSVRSISNQVTIPKNNRDST